MTGYCHRMAKLFYCHQQNGSQQKHRLQTHLDLVSNELRINSKITYFIRLISNRRSWHRYAAHCTWIIRQCFHTHLSLLCDSDWQQSHVNELCSTKITVKTSEGIFNHFPKHKEIQAQLGKMSQLKYSHLTCTGIYETPSCVLPLGLSKSVHVRISAEYMCHGERGGRVKQHTYRGKISNDMYSTGQT
jgi:hypothetical protein